MKTPQGSPSDARSSPISTSPPRRCAHSFRASAGKRLNRANTIERLQLEEALCFGVLRLVLFAAMFILIVLVNSLGEHPDDQRAVSTLLRDTLDIEDFMQVCAILTPSV